MIDKTFIKITNKNIYEKLCTIEEHVTETNGRVTLNRWIATSALCGVFGLVGWVIAIILK